MKPQDHLFLIRNFPTSSTLGKWPEISSARVTFALSACVIDMGAEQDRSWKGRLKGKVEGPEGLVEVEF